MQSVAVDVGDRIGGLLVTRAKANSARTHVTVAVAAGSALVAVAASVAAANYFTPPPQASAEGPTSDSLAIQTEANEVFEQFNGTVTQREASSLLQAWSLNGAMDQCMAVAGYPEWDWSAGHRAAPRTNALDTSLWFVAPMGHAYSNSLRDSTEYLLEEEHLRLGTVSEGEDAAVGKCLDGTSRPNDSAADEASTPKVVAGLRNDWWAMLYSWQDTYGDVDRYNDCFAQAAKGSPIPSTQGDSWKGELSTYAPPPKDVPPAGESAAEFTEGWKKFLALESALEAADWSCRSDIYEANYGDVAKAVDGFAHEHASAISDAERAWGDVQARAEKLPRN